MDQAKGETDMKDMGEVFEAMDRVKLQGKEGEAVQDYYDSFVVAIAEDHEWHDDRLMHPECPLCSRAGR